MGGAAVLGEEALAGPPGWVLAGITLFVGATAEFGKAVYSFAKSQEQEVRRLSQFGGQQAAGIAELDVGRILRDIKTAEETGGSSRELTNSINRFETQWQKIEAPLMNIANVVAGRLLDLVTSALEAVSPITDILRDISNSPILKVIKKPDPTGGGVFGQEVRDFTDSSPQWPTGPAESPNMNRAGPWRWGQ